MKLSDIKPGMKVTLRNGCEYMAVTFNLETPVSLLRVRDGNADRVGLSAYYETSLTHCNDCPSLDIVKVEHEGCVLWQRGSREGASFKLLQFGRVVKLRNGSRAVPAGSCLLVGLGCELSISLLVYDERLRNTADHDLDIVGVYRVYCIKENLFKLEAEWEEE